MTAAAANPLLGTRQVRRREIAYGDGRAATLPDGAEPVGLIRLLWERRSSGSAA